ncbi:T9SS_type A sorting domain-containing protein [Hexamita inflata]|uniref:T9SS type A sorting domain-containing protein n=1 Tax=Hexamita inflata TaxID=28002 RepID=A0AA86VT66_9EUKA|nr:T9SS type A sorting domain-containing protein [Hexamita inflata]CAI9977083.1 T9SS type A sorting domain-containing protein [Hexamita inflata]
MEYDQRMIKKYQFNIQNQVLIFSESDLQNIEFISNFNIRDLKFQQCSDLVPKLSSKTIKELTLQFCGIQSVEDFQLENLEVLILHDSIIITQIKTNWLQLTQSITKFNNLKALTLYGYNGIDISPLSKMTQLRKLILGLLGLKNTNMLQPLVNLNELFLCSNENIDITSLQFLTQLTILNLDNCCLKKIDALQSLVNLKELSLYNNENVDITPIQYLKQLQKLNICYCCIKNIDILQSNKKLEKLFLQNNLIVYIQPLYHLHSLKEVDAQSNKVIDSQTIQKLSNYGFNLSSQRQPSAEEIKYANKIRDANSPITSLNQIFSKIKILKSKFNTKIQKLDSSLESLKYNHGLFIGQVASLLQSVNTTMFANQ